MSHNAWIRSTSVLLVFCILLLCLPSSATTTLLTPSQCSQISGGWVCAVLKVIWWTFVACTSVQDGWQLLQTSTKAVNYLTDDGSKCSCSDCVVARQWQHTETSCNATDVYYHTDNYYVVE